MKRGQKPGGNSKANIPPRGRGRAAIIPDEAVQQELAGIPEEQTATALGLGHGRGRGGNNKEEWNKPRGRAKGRCRGPSPFRVPLSAFPSRDPELLAVKPPPEGEEFERLPSPPLSTHSSEDGYDLEEMLKKRNASVDKYFEELKSGISFPFSGAQRVCDEQRQRCRSGTATPTSTQSVWESDGVNSKETDPFVIAEEEGMVSERRRPVIQHIVQEEEKRMDKEIDKALATFVIPHMDFYKFDQCRKAAWHICRLERMERILRGEIFHEAPREWVDTDMEALFEKAFGPMEKSHPSYPELLKSFTKSRLAMSLEMMDHEKEVVEWMKEESVYKSEITSTMADELKEMRSKLESEVASQSEAKLDLNPYTNPFQMDYFVLPRRKHYVQDFSIVPKELEKLSEFTPEKKSAIYGMAPNPAVFDVTLQGPDLILENGGFARSLADTSGLSVKKTAKLGSKWLAHLVKLRTEINKYKDGVAAKLFIKRFRAINKMKKFERAFGKLDQNELIQLPDIFYPQTLGEGENQRVILFPSVLQGVIVTPKMILERQWNHLRHLLECETLVKLENVPAAYKRFFGSELNSFLNWGFDDIRDYIKYSVEILPEKLADVKIVDKEEPPPNENENKTDVKQEDFDCGAAGASSGGGGDQQPKPEEEQKEPPSEFSLLMDDSEEDDIDWFGLNVTLEPYDFTWEEFYECRKQRMERKKKRAMDKKSQEKKDEGQ